MPEPNRVAIVTGGNRGIGRAVAAALLKDGWRVDFCGRTEESIRPTLDDLRDVYGDAVEARPCNVRREEEVESFVAATMEGRERIDLLVNNAGVGYFAPVDELRGEDWRRVVETNLDGPFYFIRAVAPHMIARGSGWIVNIASLAARNPFAGGAAYNASKFGLLGLSDAAMLDLRHRGVRVTVILPGSVDTEFRDRPGTTDKEWMLAPDDVARAVVDLVRYPDRALPSRIELRPSHPPK
ncbi:MAG: SDR family oxidoreductase [Thermoanaerobaculia bacterium]